MSLSFFLTDASDSWGKKEADPAGIRIEKVANKFLLVSLFIKMS